MGWLGTISGFESSQQGGSRQLSSILFLTRQLGIVIIVIIATTTITTSTTIAFILIGENYSITNLQKVRSKQRY
jgi:hypothetical protein